MMNRLPAGGPILAAYALTFVASAGAPTAGMAQTTVLDIRQKIVVEQETVKVKDLLVAPNQVVEAIRGLRVMDAPVPGEKSHLTLVDLAYALQRVPELLSYHLRGPDVVVIERMVSDQFVAMTKDRIARRIAETPPWSDWEIDVSFSPFDERMLGEIGEYEDLRVRPADNLVSLGRVGFVVEFLDMEGAALHERNLTPDLRRKISAVILAAPRERGHLLQRGDLKQSPLWVGEDQKGILTHLDDCIGLELARELSGGDVLREHHLLEPLCTRRGDAVWVTCQVGGLEVRMSGMSTQQGRRGDSIRVRNPVSQKDILVSLTGPKRAQLMLGL
jgi:flagella basal body P-ring formation protein FlgA